MANLTRMTRLEAGAVLDEVDVPGVGPVPVRVQRCPAGWQATFEVRDAATSELTVTHKLVAPTLVRSQALAALYEAARRGEISAAQGIERVTRINTLKVRFLGDKVLQRTAWKVADQLGWETTYDAEFVALTQLQADIFVTSDGDLARAISSLVETATIDALRTA